MNTRNNEEYTRLILTESEAELIDILRTYKNGNGKEGLQEIFNIFYNSIQRGTHETYFFMLCALNLFAIPYIDEDIIKQFLVENIEDKELLKQKGVI